MQCPRVAIFDLDDTLAESFQPPTQEMVERFRALLVHIRLAIMTAAEFARIDREVLSKLTDAPDRDKLYIFPNSTAECYAWANNAWGITYSKNLTNEERDLIRKALEECLAETNIIDEHPKYKPMIIDREAQIAFAAVGLDASLEDKKSWDPDQAKRKRLVAVLEKKIPQFEILMGGMTTIDITHKGINKAYGVQWLSKHLNIPTSEMLYVGDALYPGGNDEVVIATGIQTRAVSGPSETLTVIDELLAACSAKNI